MLRTQGCRHRGVLAVWTPAASETLALTSKAGTHCQLLSKASELALIGGVGHDMYYILDIVSMNPINWIPCPTYIIIYKREFSRI